MANKPIEIAEAMRRAQQDPIWAWRGHAIGAYATLESSLCHLLAVVAEMKHENAAIIFYKITNADVRNKILEQLIKRRFGSAYNLFCNSFFRAVRVIDGERNSIVHWAPMNEIKSLMEDGFEVEVSLRPGNYWSSINLSTGEQTKIRTVDLVQFIMKCDVYSRACNMLFMFLGGHLDQLAAERDTWHQIFLKPLVYPLPEGHPLALRPQVHDNPPQSSPA